ncbi:hypothetical protein LPN04_11440 [Rugamonas sp. A1-17]|nr:hypothetical protein [Rugamonas sp. A1-17]
MSTALPRAALLALLAWPAIHTAPAAAQQVALGRLFATPDERVAMDRQRDAGPAAAPASNDPAAAQQAAQMQQMQQAQQMQQMQQIQQMQQLQQSTSQTPGAPPGYVNPDPNAAQPAPQATAQPAPPASSAVQLSGVLRGSSGRTTVWLNQVPQTGGVKAGPGPAVSLRLSSGRQLIMKPGQSFDPANGSVQEIGR